MNVKVVQNSFCFRAVDVEFSPKKIQYNSFVLIVMKYDLHVHDDIEYYLLYWVDESGSIVVMISFTQFFQGCRHIIISDSE